MGPLTVSESIEAPAWFSGWLSSVGCMCFHCVPTAFFSVEKEG